MSTVIDFYFDFSSSYSYIGQHRLRKLAEEHEVSLRWKPIALGAIFKALGHMPPTPDTPKGAYIWRDVERSAAEWGLPFKWPQPFPFNSIPAARVFYVLAEGDEDTAVRWAIAVFEAAYGQGRDCSDPSVLIEVAESIGIDTDGLMERTADEAVKQKLKDVTAEASGRGVFGTPAYFLDDELYWGADRIDQMLRRLGGG
jgi:2-hydroxychromene-2-carboxylate isomerase